MGKARNVRACNTIRIVRRGGSCPELARSSAHGAPGSKSPKPDFAGFLSVDISVIGPILIPLEIPVPPSLAHVE